MAALLITYDIANEHKDKRDLLHEWITKRHHAALSESAYVLHTDDSAKVVYDAIRSLIGDTEWYYVATLHGAHYGYVPSNVKEWLTLLIPLT